MIATTRLYAHASTAAAILLTAGACYAAADTTWWPAISGLLPAGMFVWNASRCYTQARRERAIEQRLERLTHDEPAAVELPPVCCSFWRHTDGEVHSPSDCTRPAPAPTTLTPAEGHAFTEIASAFHQAGGAV